jgi:hypothetical protein
MHSTLTNSKCLQGFQQGDLAPLLGTAQFGGRINEAGTHTPQYRQNKAGGRQPGLAARKLHTPAIMAGLAVLYMQTKR